MPYRPMSVGRFLRASDTTQTAQGQGAGPHDGGRAQCAAGAGQPMTALVDSTRIAEITGRKLRWVQSYG